MTDILMYHGTPQHCAAEFERQMRILAALFDIVPLEKAVLAPAGGRRQVALTFDDGLRNNLTVAYPILAKLRLPATFFVCPGLINRRRWLWTHEARARLHFLGAQARQALAAHCGGPAALEPFVQWMKTLDADAFASTEQLLRRASRGFVSTPAQREAFDLAGWDELRGLDPAIATVGSHGMTHAILTSLPPASSTFEIGESRRQIENQLGRPARTFCYPNGDLHAGVVEAVRAHYEIAVTTEPRRAEPGCDPLRLPRWAGPDSLLRLARVLFPYPVSRGWLAVSEPTRRAATFLSASLRTLTWLVSRA